MEYTKGEWYLELRPTDNVRRVRCNSEVIADVFGTNAEDEANARLIAAAPDLYEACKQALRTFEVGNIKSTDPRYLMLKQAVTKAEK